MSMRNYDLSPLLRQWIGFDKLASSMGNQDAVEFPPYNIEKIDDNHYRITLALAGFRQSELDIEVEGQRLTVKGTPTLPEKKSAVSAPRAGVQTLHAEFYPGRAPACVTGPVPAWVAAY
ncbi:hypothetical protein OS12_31170 [Dickeya oryzae]